MPSYRVNITNVALKYDPIYDLLQVFVCVCLIINVLVFHCTSELSKWLEPLEKLRFELGSIPTLIDYIKQVQISRSIYVLLK